MIKDLTKRKIDKAVAKTLKEAGMREPPFLIEDLLEHLGQKRGSDLCGLLPKSNFNYYPRLK